MIPWISTKGFALRNAFQALYLLINIQHFYQIISQNLTFLNVQKVSQVFVFVSQSNQDLKVF